MTIPIYYIKSGNLSFADKIIFENLELYLSGSDKICLVGRNGCGKSSLMKIISGIYELDKGEVYKHPGLKIGYLKQDIDLVRDMPVHDFIYGDLEDLEKKFLADEVLKGLEISLDSLLSSLSGGMLRRVFLAKILVESPDVLLLDEPTNHLDIRAVLWLEEFIKQYKGAIICISHDRRFLSNVTNKIWWLDRGILRKSNSGFAKFDEWQELIIAEEEAILKKLNKKLDEEKIWLSQGVTARRKRNQKRLTSLRALREQTRNFQNHLKNSKRKLEFELEEAKSKSQFILEADNINYHLQDRHLIKDFSIRIKKGEKIGLIGPNGCGKSTLIKILIGENPQYQGKVRRANNLEITYFDQAREDLNLDKNLEQNICPTGTSFVFTLGKEMHVASYLRKFLFDPKQLKAKVSTLSGGERNRLLLAKKLLNPGNFMVLDEPTNDLDMDSLDLLLEILADYDGTLLVVSHDRDFLDKLVTRAIIFTKDGQILDNPGGYEDYEKYFIDDEIISKPEKVKRTLDSQNQNKQNNKISYKLLHLQKTLPGEIEKIELKISELESKLADMNLFSKDPEKYNKFAKDLEKFKQEHEHNMSLWIETEEEISKQLMNNNS